MKSVLYHLGKEGTKESGSFIFQIFRILKTFAAACFMIVFQIQSWGNLNYFYFFRTKINMVKLRRNIFIHGWKRRKVFSTRSAFRSRKLLWAFQKDLFFATDKYISLSVLHMIFYVSRTGSQSSKVLFIDPIAQILGGLRVKQETNTRKLLLWSQEMTCDKRWNSQTQFLGPQQGFCQIWAMWDQLPWWSYSGTPRNHSWDLPAYL